MFKKDLSSLGPNSQAGLDSASDHQLALGEAEAALHKPHIHIHTISDDPSSPTHSDALSRYRSRSPSGSVRSLASTLRSRRGEVGSYQNRTEVAWAGGARKRVGEYMDLEEALSIIQREEEHVSIILTYSFLQSLRALMHEFDGNRKSWQSHILVIAVTLRTM